MPSPQDNRETSRKKPVEPGSPEAVALQTKFMLWFGLFAALPIVIVIALGKIGWGKSGQASATPTPPTAPFAAPNETAGIRFTHQNGAAGEKLLPETMGGGVAFFDADGDGSQDLLCLSSLPKGGGLVLLLNDGKGRFRDATAGSGLAAPAYGMGIAAGDFDNDGKVDVFLSGVGGNLLFHNEGGAKFRDVTQSMGLAADREDWGTSCAWIDYDNDGDLDLFICNYVRWSREIDLKVDYKLAGIGRAYGPPTQYQGGFPRLWRNDGARFTDLSEEAGLRIRNKATGEPIAKSLGVAPVDLDGDGWIDLIVANDTAQNFVFHNERNGTFKEIGAQANVAYDAFGSTRGAMGIDTGRFQADNALGISIGNFANEMTALYVSQQDPLLFTDEAMSQGIGSASRSSLTFGVFFFDYDLDGWMDLLTVNGHIEPEIQKISKGQNYLQSAQLFWNTRASARGGGFHPVGREQAGGDIFTPLAGRGSAYADVDGDGDLDVVIAQVGGPVQLFLNRQELRHHWLRVKLAGTTSNRDAIGAWVKARVGGRTTSQQVMPTRGYLSQSELPVTIGLVGAVRIDDLLVVWPDGSRQNVKVDVVDRMITVEQNKR